MICNRILYFTVIILGLCCCQGFAWVNGDVSICTAIYNQFLPSIASDTSGGAIVTWYDFRVNGANSNIYSQKVNSSGSTLWKDGGVVICTAANYQDTPVIASDGAGGGVIAWHDARNGLSNIYVQRVNSSGSTLWTLNGIAICTGINTQNSIGGIASDGSGGAVIVWEDYRTANNYHVYAQRVNSTGSTLWTGNGVPVCTAGNSQYSPVVIGDGTGGAFITWYDTRNGLSNDDIYAQRISSAGTTLWQTNGIPVCTVTSFQDYPVLASDSAGGIFIAWQDSRTASTTDIYVQRMNSVGTTLWTTNGLALCTAAGYQFNPSITNDGNGGVIIAWYDLRAGNGESDIYAQRVNASGSIQWGNNGLAVCTATNQQKYPLVSADGAGGCIISWQDSRYSNVSTLTYMAYGQRINSNSSFYWNADGVPLSTITYASTNNPGFVMAGNGAGSAILAWEDFRNGVSNSDIFAQSVDSSGLLPVPLFTASPTIGDGPLSVIFADSSLNNPLSWKWDFGDGGSDTLQNPTHQYSLISVSKSYNVQLVVINTFGASTLKRKDYIIVINPAVPTITNKAVYNDINNNGIVDAGDTLTMQFPKSMLVNNSSPSSFFLAVTTDFLGAGATVFLNTANKSQVIITLGTSPTITIPGVFNINTTISNAPSGIDISASISPGAIIDDSGKEVEDEGVPGLDDSGNDISFSFITGGFFIPAFGSATVQVGQDSDNGFYTKHKLIIPPNSLTTTTTITFGNPGDNHGQLSAFALGPITVSFSTTTPAFLVMEFKDGDTRIAEGYLPHSMRIHQYSTTAQAYIPVPETFGTQVIDTVNKTVTVPVTSFDVFNQAELFSIRRGALDIPTIIPFANIAIPTVDNKSYTVSPSSNPRSFTSTVTLTVGTAGIYTRNQLTVPNYQISGSGITIGLLQASFVERNGWSTNAVMKVTATDEPGTQEILTMEYKDHNDAGGKFTNDVINGTEGQMRVYRWRSDLSQWQKIPGVQSIDTNLNIVSVTITDALTTSQIYAVGVDTSAPPVSIEGWNQYSMGLNTIKRNLTNPIFQPMDGKKE